MSRRKYMVPLASALHLRKRQKCSQIHVLLKASTLPFNWWHAWTFNNWDSDAYVIAFQILSMLPNLSSYSKQLYGPQTLEFSIMINLLRSLEQLNIWLVAILKLYINEWLKMRCAENIETVLDFGFNQQQMAA